MLIDPIDGAHLYGAPLDLACAALERVLTIDPYVIRHMVIAATGWLGIVLCGMLADRLFGPPHGLLALVLLAVSPVYMAHAMNNPKDIPFATAATALLLALTRVGASKPFLSWRLVLVLALVIGASLNVRPGGLLFVGYLAVVVLFRIVSTGPLPPIDACRDRAAAGRGRRRRGGDWMGGLAVGVHESARRALQGPGRTGPFRLGRDGPVRRAHLCRNVSASRYVPQWFWLVLSPVVLVGLALSLLRLRELEIRGQIIAMWGAMLFPIAST